MKETQYIYVLTNTGLRSDLLKIGKTTRPNERLKELSNFTGVPAPYECLGLFEVKNMNKVESSLHSALATDRFNPKREFFTKDYEEIYPLLCLLGKDVTSIIHVDKEEEEEIKIVKKKTLRSRFSFIDAGIPMESVLEFRDGTYQCVVKEEYRVEYEGELIRLSPLTQKLMNRTKTIRGPSYWKYKGRLLEDIYEEYHSALRT